MVRFYRERGLPRFADDEAADMGALLEDEEAVASADIEAELLSVITAWPDNARDSKYEALQVLLRDLHAEESKRKILWDNCAAYYGLPS